MMGSAFKGWHTQKDVQTIQGILNMILSLLYNEKIFTWGSGRTDSGTHAIRYTAHFRTHKNIISIHKLKTIINDKLPPQIRIYDVLEESDKFHATFTCKARSYCYFIYIGDILSPHLYKRVYHEKEFFNINCFKETMNLFKGNCDFAHFCYGYSKKE